MCVHSLAVHSLAASVSGGIPFGESGAVTFRFDKTGAVAFSGGLSCVVNVVRQPRILGMT